MRQIRLSRLRTAITSRFGVKAPEQTSQRQDEPVDFGKSQQPGARRARPPRPRTEAYDLQLEHWKFLLRVLYIFVATLLGLMVINYGAQWLKLSVVIEFKEFAAVHYTIVCFSLWYGTKVVINLLRQRSSRPVDNVLVPVMLQGVIFQTINNVRAMVDLDADPSPVTIRTSALRAGAGLSL